MIPGMLLVLEGRRRHLRFTFHPRRDSVSPRLTITGDERWTPQEAISRLLLVAISRLVYTRLWAFNMVLICSKRGFVCEKTAAFFSRPARLCRNPVGPTTLWNRLLL